MAYEPRAHDGSLWGFYHELIAPTAEKLRAYFEAGIPVILSGDGLTYRAERVLPGDEVLPDEEGFAGD
ncbi:MAG: hypothetical protein ACD_54C00416G0002 [uncultured bacterium]|nr:MAG: hypothetical protein ACD_54C00416G0002 [uncultured bacterium]